MKKIRKVFAPIIASMIFSVPSISSAEWTITGLGASLSGPGIHLTGFNNSGQIVGWEGSDYTYTRAFITGPNGSGKTSIDMPGGAFGKATGINDSGQVTGTFSFTAPNPMYPDHSPVSKGSFTHSFITDANGEAAKDLGVMKWYEGDWGEYYEYNAAAKINESGQIAGSELRNLNGRWGVAYTTGPNGSDMRELTTPFSTRATAINDSGQVAGYSIEGEGEYLPWQYGHAFITGPDGNGITYLDDFGGHYSAAYGINNAGKVVGRSETPSPPVSPGSPYYESVYHAFVTGDNGVGITDLGTFGGKYTSAYDINEHDQIIGTSTTSDGSYHAFLYTNGHMIDLSILPEIINAGWSNIGVSAINDHGQILGSGTLQGNTQAFILSPSPVPEPSTYAMLLAGLGLVGFSLKHQTKSSRVNA